MIPRSVTEPSWLTVSGACQVLGVDASTLRLWTDAGRIRAFRTPGGHRRYRQEDLTVFLHSQQQKPHGPIANVIGERGARLIPGTSRRRIREQHWYADLDPKAAEAMRLTCRTLMDALSTYLTGGRGRRAALAAGEEAGRALGVQVAALRLSPAEATRTFLFFKGSITQSVSSRLPLPSERRVRSIRYIDLFLDRVLVQMMAVYGQTS
jgi:excisionase family DNA binding protein